MTFKSWYKGRDSNPGFQNGTRAFQIEGTAYSHSLLLVIRKKWRVCEEPEESTRIITSCEKDCAPIEKGKCSF